VRYINGSGKNTPTSVSVTGNILTITLGTNDSGIVSATAQDALQAVVANPAAAALVAKISPAAITMGITGQSALPGAKPTAHFNVKDYGAVGDNQTINTEAFQRALDACDKAGGGEVVVPEGNYLTGSIELHSNTTLRLEKGVFVIETASIDQYPLITGRFEGATTQVHRGLIFASKANHITIAGPGGFVANSSIARLRNPRAPVVVETVDCNDVTFDGFNIQYDLPVGTNIWCIHPLYCTNLTVKGLYIRSQGTNGDGIDIDSCAKVLVQDCDISAGDDAISIKSGRGMDAVRIGKPTEDVVIKDSILRSTKFAAIGFGTEISGGVRNISVSNCTISGVQNAIFIKSRDGRGAIMENITLDNITVDKSPTFVGIDLISKGIQASEPVPGDVEKWTLVRNLTFKNIKVNDVAKLVETQASRATAAIVGGPGVPPERPIDGFSLSNITGTCGSGITLANVINANFNGINVTGFTGRLLNLTNVKGTGLDDPTKAAGNPPSAAAPAATGDKSVNPVSTAP